MKILNTDDQKTLALFFDLKEGKDLQKVFEAAIATLNKQSNAYKIAKKLSDELPVF